MLKFLIVIVTVCVFCHRLNPKAYWITNLVRVQFYFLAQLLLNVLISLSTSKFSLKSEIAITNRVKPGTRLTGLPVHLAFS